MTKSQSKVKPSNVFTFQPNANMKDIQAISCCLEGFVFLEEGTADMDIYKATKFDRRVLVLDQYLEILLLE